MILVLFFFLLTVGTLTKIFQFPITNNTYHDSYGLLGLSSFPSYPCLQGIVLLLVITVLFCLQHITFCSSMTISCLSIDCCWPCCRSVFIFWSLWSFFILPVLWILKRLIASHVNSQRLLLLCFWCDLCLWACFWAEQLLFNDLSYSLTPWGLWRGFCSFSLIDNCGVRASLRAPRLILWGTCYLPLVEVLSDSKISAVILKNHL